MSHGADAAASMTRDAGASRTFHSLFGHEQPPVHADNAQKRSQAEPYRTMEGDRNTREEDDEDEDDSAWSGPDDERDNNGAVTTAAAPRPDSGLRIPVRTSGSLLSTVWIPGID